MLNVGLRITVYCGNVVMFIHHYGNEITIDGGQAIEDLHTGQCGIFESIQQKFNPAGPAPGKAI